MGSMESHGHHETPERRIFAALVLTLAVMGVSAAGGLLSGSLALLSDAGHMLADAGALSLALVAQRIADRPRTQKRTYGSRRAETLAAFVNAVLLCFVALWVIAEAIERWDVSPPIRGGWMLAVAVVGLLANLGAAWLLDRGHGHNANTRAALAHVLADAAGSVAAILAAVAVLAWDWRRADVLISVVLAVMILVAAWGLVSRTLHVLMEGTPAGVATGELERTIRETPGVADLHDLHAWSISEGFDVVTVHVVLDGARHGTEVAHEVAERIRRIHGIDHVTVQPEAPRWTSSFQPLSTLVRRQR